MQSDASPSSGSESSSSTTTTPPVPSVVVFTVGVFDLLHPGHVGALTRMRALGTELVVGVVADDVIARYKRLPILTMHERATMLSALRCVDKVILDAPLPDDTTTDVLDEMGVAFLAKAFEPEERERGLREHAHLAEAGRFVEIDRSGEAASSSTTSIIARVVAAHAEPSARHRSSPSGAS